MRVDNDLSPQVIQCDIHGANGLAFSEDKRWMYTSDTPNAVIYRTALDEQGEVGKREVFRRFQPGEGIPDGAAIDTEGCYWSAMFDGWRIARFFSDGRATGGVPSTGALPDDGVLWRSGYENALYHDHAGEYGC
ncbi:gluconolactonase [Klebsiella oxytoca]|nr:gluconolactonase [Klebsiella oxytoca]